jgi:hypothetical protein
MFLPVASSSPFALSSAFALSSPFASFTPPNNNLPTTRYKSQMSSDDENYFIDAHGKHMILMLAALQPLTKAVSRKSEGARPSRRCGDLNCILTAAVCPNNAVQIPLLRRAAAPRTSKYYSLSIFPSRLHSAKWATPQSIHNLQSLSPALKIFGFKSNGSRNATLECNLSKISAPLIKQRITVTTTITTSSTTHPRQQGMTLYYHQKQIFITYCEGGMTNGCSKILAWREEVRRITGHSLEQVGVCMVILRCKC